jgi:hypothetical protein
VPRTVPINSSAFMKFLPLFKADIRYLSAEVFHASPLSDL